MHRARVFVVAAALSSALCAAGPKVDIRVIPRPRVEAEEEAEEVVESPVSLLTPSRDPFPVFEGTCEGGESVVQCIQMRSVIARSWFLFFAGPFTDEERLPCFRDERATEPGKR